MSVVDLTTHVAGLTLANPLLPGSGPPGDNLAKLRTLQEAGIGALVTKTISVQPPHIPKPCMAFEGDLFFNVEKWSDKPVETWLRDILPGLQPRTVPLLVSLGYSSDDLQQLIPAFEAAADGFEISTHYIADNPEQLRQTVKALCALTAKPIVVKLSAHARDIAGSAIAAEQGGAAAITAINSIGPVLAIDVEKRASRLGEDSPYAWLSGPAIKPIALRCVYDIQRAVRIPVIGCGGVSRGTDVLEFILAGASAVECCTGLIRKGPGLIASLLQDITDWCDAHHVHSLAELRGSALPSYRPSSTTL
jgi:dihydroorotate dehydrogenase (fumarate)